MNENTKTAFDHLDDLLYVYESSVLKAFGKCFVDQKRFTEAITNTRNALRIELEKAKSIEVREQIIYEEGEKKKEEMLRQTEEMIMNLDVVREANLYAKEITEAAKQEAERIKLEAEEVREKTISHGEKVKNELIYQGHQFLGGILKNSLTVFDDNQKQLIKTLESHREKMQAAYEEISPMVNKEEEETEQVKVS